MNIWVILIAAGLLTYGIRLSFILLLDYMDPPPLVKRALRFVPVAVLSAIVFPELLLQNNILYISLANGRLLAGLLAGLVAWRTRNPILTILAGMAALYIFKLI